MKNIVGAILVITLLALLPVAMLRDHNVAHAATGCTAATLTGNYGFTENVGFITLASRSPALFTPAARLGLIPFSGGSGSTGTFTISFAQSVNGNIISDQSSGPYTVNSDCTGSINLVTGNAAGEVYAISIVSGGTEVLAMRTDPGATIDATMKKQ